MSWLEIVLVVVLSAVISSVIGGIAASRLTTTQVRFFARRIGGLPLRAKAELGWRLVRDLEIPLAVRLILPGLLAYLVLPVDLIPDFIPVIGQLDDILIVVIGIGLVVRLTPVSVLESHLSSLEAKYAVIHLP